MNKYERVAGLIETDLASRHLDGYEISFGSSRNLSIEVKEQEIDTFRSSAPAGVSIRVLKSGGMGFSYSTSLDDAALSRMVQNAVLGAENQTPDPANCFPLPQEYPAVAGLFDNNLSAVDETEKIQLAKDLERLALGADPRVKRVRKAIYGESEYAFWIRNSVGVVGGYSGTSVSCSVTVVAEEGDDSQMGWDFGFSSFLSGIDVETIAANAVAKALGTLGAIKIPTMNSPAILDNHVASEIVEVLSSSFLAENVQKGKSMLAGRLGEKLFSPLIQIRDDGTLSGGISTAPFDAEGVAHRNNLLVEDGRLKAFLYDSRSAWKDRAVSTGNAVRGGVKSPLRTGVTNFFIVNGSTPRDEMIRGIERGVLITEVMGIHTANGISGDFSVGAAGFFIEKGVIAYPIKGIAIAGNIFDLFRAVEMVGDDIRFFGGVGSPSLKISTLDMSGS
ncbi:MAG: TldD/PmbA family protein [Deltaproteobacteria bacterium]